MLRFADVSFSADGWTAVLTLFIMAAIPIAILTYITSRIGRIGHRQKALFDNVIKAAYEPPEGLSPAEFGYLFDSRLAEAELLATLLAMEQKGYIGLTNDQVRGVIIHYNTPAARSELNAHETYLIDNLGAETPLAFFKLPHMRGFRQAVRNDLAAGGFVAGRRAFLRHLLGKTLLAYFIITGILWALMIWAAPDDRLGIAFVGFLFIYVIGFPFFLGLALIATWVGNVVSGQHGVWSPKLKQIWPDIEGYRQYIEMVELDELQFESEDLKQLSKNKALPYAVALGLNTDWKKRFEK